MTKKYKLTKIIFFNLILGIEYCIEYCIEYVYFPKLNFILFYFILFYLKGLFLLTYQIVSVLYHHIPSPFCT